MQPIFSLYDRPNALYLYIQLEENFVVFTMFEPTKSFSACYNM